MTTLTNNRENTYLTIIGILSVAVPIVVAILLFMPTKLALEGRLVYFLPHLNGMINTATSIALVAGVIFIKNGQKKYHQFSMTLAFIFGAIFLVSYVIYHASVEPTRFGGEGLVRTVYFSVLISHIILAAIVLPFVLLSFYYAWTEKFERHRKVVKYAFPIWLYVSVTGVIAYLMIAPYYEF